MKMFDESGEPATNQPAMADVPEKQLRQAQPRAKKIDVKAALQINADGKTRQSIIHLAHSDPSETIRRTMLICLIGALFDEPSDLADLAQLLRIYGLISPDHPAVSQASWEWSPDQREQRRLQILEMVAERLPEETLAGLAEPGTDGKRKPIWEVNNTH